MATPIDLLGRTRGALGSPRLRARLLTTLLAPFLALTVSAAAGCGDASSSSEPDASAHDADPGGRADAARPSDARPGPDADPNAPDAGAQSCGGITGAQCRATEFCDYPNNDCGGAADGTGTCMPRPQVCQPVVDEVCGCNGSTYSTECSAQMAGTDIVAEGPC